MRPMIVSDCKSDTGFQFYDLENPQVCDDNSIGQADADIRRYRTKSRILDPYPVAADAGMQMPKIDLDHGYYDRYPFRYPWSIQIRAMLYPGP